METIVQSISFGFRVIGDAKENHRQGKEKSTRCQTPGGQEDIHVTE